MAESFNEIRRCLSAKISELGIQTVPVDISAIAHQLGVVEIAPRMMSFDGYLARRADGKFAIRYKSGVDPCRTRFTIAHEVGHILHSHVTGKPVDGIVARGSERCDEDERHANFAAAELLMPEKFVAGHLQSHSVSWGCIWSLASILKVSRAALVRRTTELQSIFAVEAQVSWSKNTQQSRRNIFIRHSPIGQVLLRTAPARLMDGILEEMTTQNSHRWPISFNGTDLDIRCVGRLVTTVDGSGYQLIGWDGCASESPPIIRSNTHSL